ncbi:hypothetical protein ACE6H2_011063 [Prunus campanulata]
MGGLNWDCRLIMVNATLVWDQEGRVGLTQQLVDSVAFAWIRPMQAYVMQLYPEHKEKRRKLQ